MDYHISTLWICLLVVLAVWEVIWKGVALWKAGQSRQVGWFVAILVVNTAGLLPIAYLLFWAKGASHGKS